MIRAYAWGPDDQFREPAPKEVEALVGDPQVLLWVDVEAPSPDDLAWLARVFPFHALSLEDCSKHVDLPKIDEFAEHIFVIVHGVEGGQEEGALHYPQVNLFLAPRYLVSVHLPPVAAVEGVGETVVRSSRLLAEGPDFVFHAIVDRLVDAAFPLLDRWDEEIDRLEDRVLAGSGEAELGRDVTAQVLVIKRKVLALMRRVGPQREVVTQLARGGLPGISERVRIHLRDVYDHQVRVHEVLEMLRDLVTSIFEAHLSMVSTRLNAVMGRLTIIATIFLPLTFLVGLYGMNFDPAAAPWSMPELRWRYGYPAILGAMLLIGAAMLLYFRKRRWF